MEPSFTIMLELLLIDMRKLLPSIAPQTDSGYFFIMGVYYEEPLRKSILVRFIFTYMSMY